MWIDKTREASDRELLDGMLPHIRDHFALLGRPEDEYRICHIPVFAYGISVTVYSKKASVLRDLIRVCSSQRRNSSTNNTTTTAVVPASEYRLPSDAKLRFNTASASGEVWLQIEFDSHEEAEGFAKHVWVEWTLVRKGQQLPKMIILPDGLYLRDQRPTTHRSAKNDGGSRHGVDREDDDRDVAAHSRSSERDVGHQREGYSGEKRLSEASSSAESIGRPSNVLESILRDRMKRARADDIPSTHHGSWNTGNLVRRDGAGLGNGREDVTASDIREFTDRLSSDELLLLRRLNISVGDVLSNPLRVESFALSELRDHRLDQSALLQLVHKSRTRLHCL